MLRAISLLVALLAGVLAGSFLVALTVSAHTTSCGIGFVDSGSRNFQHFTRPNLKAGDDRETQPIAVSPGVLRITLISKRSLRNGRYWQQGGRA